MMSRSTSSKVSGVMFALPVYRTLKISITESADPTCDALAELVIDIISRRAARANSGAEK